MDCFIFNVALGCRVQSACVTFLTRGWDKTQLKNERSSGLAELRFLSLNQLVLPIGLEVKLQENDIAFVVNDLVESIPEEAFHYRETGRPSYHPRMMLKIILCAYAQSVFSGRKIEALLKDSIRMMRLAQGNEPYYRTINRFRVSPHVKELLRRLFVQFRCQSAEEKIIEEEEAIFIDGTKIEVNANKFTFVWKKSIQHYSVYMAK